MRFLLRFHEPHATSFGVLQLEPGDIEKILSIAAEVARRDVVDIGIMAGDLRLQPNDPQHPAAAYFQAEDPDYCPSFTELEGELQGYGVGQPMEHHELRVGRGLFWVEAMDLHQTRYASFPIDVDDLDGRHPP